MTTGICRSCGKSIGRGGTKCAGCWKTQRAAAVDGYAYQRTHVHVGADGRLTIEVGIECGEGCAA